MQSQVSLEVEDRGRRGQEWCDEKDMTLPRKGAMSQSMQAASRSSKGK